MEARRIAVRSEDCEMRIEDIAHALGISRSSVQTALRVGTEKMKSALLSRGVTDAHIKQLFEK